MSTASDDLQLTSGATPPLAPIPGGGGPWRFCAVRSSW